MRQRFGKTYLPEFGALVALVPDQHYRYLTQVGTLDLLDEVPYGLELLQALPARHRTHQDEGVPLADRQPLHGGELVRTGRVRYLQRAYVLVAADHL